MLGIFGLLILGLLLGAASSAQAGEFCSADPYFGVIDGNVLSTPPIQITIDTDCTFQNWPDSRPLTTTVNFQTNDPSIYLIIFDNVIFTGNMACANVDHRIWFSNGSDYGSNNNCQDLFIPVETIDKQNPIGQPSVSVGVPFTYTLTLPSMQLSGDPSINDLHTVVLWDDLTATGADLTFVSLNAYYEGSGAPVTLVPEDDPSARGGVWTPKNLSYKPIALLPAGEQIIVEITVVLDNTPANAAGMQFVNTAKWWFGRLIDGVFYEPLPGEWGVTQPLTIAEPILVVTKSSSETALNLGIPANFTIDVQNVGGSAAWGATILDQFPDGADGGMCDYNPISGAGVSAQIFAADGTTPVSGPLNQGGDFSVSYSGAPGCQLSLTLESAAAVIGPSQHLIISYQSQIDGDSIDGVALTNVAGVTRWFSGDDSLAGRRQYDRGPLTDGTPGVIDFQDSETLTTALSGYYFQKTVANLTSGANPATTAAPGDTLRYRLRLFNVDQTIDAIMISDQLDPVSFDLNSFSITTPPPVGATSSFDSGTGLLQINGSPAPLNIVPGDELVVEFDVTLKSTLGNGTQVVNQAVLSATDLTADSDDPYVNGIAPPGEPADPTRVVIQSPGPLAKTSTQASATIGEQFSYRITVPATPTAVPLNDVRILDDLSLSTADLRFVSANVVSDGSWSLSNTGSATNLIIEDTATGIDIPANGQAVIEITVELLNTATDQSGLSFQNSATYTYNRMNGNSTSQTPGGGGNASAMTVVEPDLTATKAVSFVTPAGKLPTDPATVGDVLAYTVTMSNSGNSTAFDTSVVDTLPANVALVPGAATARINGIDVAGFVAEPIPLPGGGFAWGQQNGDVSLDIPAGQALVLTYQVTVVSVTGAAINNSVYVDWTSLDGGTAAERTGGDCPIIDALNDYCYGPATVSVTTLDNTSLAKAVFADSYAEIPASTAEPILRVGDTVTYDLTLNLQEYTTRNVVVEDALPEGLALESFVMTGGAGFSYTLAAQPAVGATGPLSWVFGDIANPPSNDGTPIDPLVIRYVARVVTDAPPVGVAYATSILRDNLAQLTYSGGDPALDPGRLTAAATIDIRQPQMRAISKVDLGGGRSGSGTAADPYQVNIATDVMNFRLSSCNDGLAPAYGVVLTDLLAPELDEGDLAANPPVVTVGTTTLNAGSDYTYAAPARGGELRIALLDSAPVNQGECVSVDYSLGFHTDLTVSTTWSNQARLAEYRSLPLAEPGRLYAPSNTAEVWMTNLASPEQLLKTLVSPAETTIGDTVVYQIRVPAVPMNTALDNVVVTDTLHSALEYIGASAVDAGGAAVVLTDNSVAPGQINLGIAHLPAGGQAIITLTARVINNAQANAGVSFANTASYTWTSMPVGLDTSSTSGPLTIVEPAVALAKMVANLSNPGAEPQAGDILRYSVSFSAGGGAAGDNFSDAFDLALLDSLSLGLAYQSGTASVDGPGNAITDPVVTGDGSTTAQTLTWGPADATADIDVVEGTLVTVTYDVLVLNGVLPGQELTNSVSIRWTGLDGDNGFERTGSGTPVENDYFTGPVTTSLRTALAISFVKSVVNATTGEDPGANASPGDTLRYTLELINGSIIPLTSAALVDELAAQFAPGSLQLVTVPTDAVTAATDAFGGSNGTGMIDIRNLILEAQGNPGDSLRIVFEATLAPVIQSGTAVLNRAQLSGDNLVSATSNETSTLISSAPAFEVWKTSQDLTGDPAVLMAGDTLRYTITVKNIGNENAVNATLQDQIPTNTSYVAGSTTLNGNPVADPAGGSSPLQDGLAIHAPEDPTAGALRADATATTDNVATISFDVVIDSDVVDGAIIANQGFLNATGTGSGPASEEPSDDPATAVLDDPTRDVVGNLPLVDAHKTVQILVDGGSAGNVDPGDVLQYTIVISNTAATPATGVVFTDAVPADTTYVSDSVQLNGLAVGIPDGGISPLVSGIAVSSADLTPPLPGAGNGTLSSGGSATLIFEVQVNAGVAPGTIISNQGVVSSNELPDEPTDADGIDANGDQPTQVVVGAAQQLSILKEVSVVGGGTALPGALLEYLVRATNIGSLPATNVVVTDDLGSLAGQLSYVPGSGSLNGSAAGVSFAGSLLTADYAAQYGDLPPGASAVLRFRVQIAPLAAVGSTLTNTGVVNWNDPTQSAAASVSVAVGGTPGSGILNGRAWHDASLDKIFDGSERALEGWTVELYRGNQLLASLPTDAGGVYRFSGLLPTAGAETYEIRFRALGAGPNTPSLGHADSPFSNGPQWISTISVAAGDNLQNLNLPLTPNGTVYDSIVRVAVPGSRLTLLNATASQPLPGGCFDDPLQQDQVTAQDGFYKFDLNFSDPACQAGAGYVIEVTPPAAGYEAGPSRIIPPAETPAVPFSVPACPGSPDDALPTTVDLCEVSPSGDLPPTSVPPRTAGTTYHLYLILSNAVVPGQSQVFNNHIPVDPQLDGAVAISKSSSLINVSKGGLVPYTITLTNLFGAPLYDLQIVDDFPAGFKYVAGSARLNGESREPLINGRQLSWDGLVLQNNAKQVVQLLLAVGAGVSEGEFVNRAQAINSASGDPLSGTATATVRVVPDPTFDCTDVVGKVFDDRNLDGRQDAGEEGLAGVRLVTVRGLISTTDANGRFHIACAEIPDAERGSNFILKLDDRSLPTGFRLTTENPRIQRATRGKLLRFNFGATIHRVVGFDVADGGFEPETTRLRLQWQARLTQLLEVLQTGPAVLRLSYLADVEKEGLVRERLKALKQEIAQRWQQEARSYRLTIETEMFWRRGGPP
jgi:uncharacterized repeat protein (TIGR01451 family)/fimbrial isopeptide formation D2 family protein